MNRFRFGVVALLALLPLVATPAFAKLTLTKRAVNVDIGAAEKIVVTSDDPAGAKWESKDPAVAQVFGNGWVVGVSGGKTVVRVADGNDTQDFDVTVDSPDKKLRKLSDFKQFPDNRIFRIKGRKYEARN